MDHYCIKTNILQHHHSGYSMFCFALFCFVFSFWFVHHGTDQYGNWLWWTFSMWLHLFRFSWRFLFANVFLKSPRNDIIYQRPSFANGVGRYIPKDESPKVRQIWKLKSMLRHHYSTRKYLFIIFLLISNDIQLSPRPLDSSTLKSCSLNARSIINKRTELQAMVVTKVLEIIAITETWLNPDIMDQEILSSDYNIYRKDRLDRQELLAPCSVSSRQ